MYFSVLGGQMHFNDGLIQPSWNAMSSMLTRIQAFPLKIVCALRPRVKDTFFLLIEI